MHFHDCSVSLGCFHRDVPIAVFPQKYAHRGVPTVVHTQGSTHRGSEKTSARQGQWKSRSMIKEVIQAGNMSLQLQN